MRCLVEKFIREIVIFSSRVLLLVITAISVMNYVGVANASQYTVKYSSLVIDADSGLVISQENAGEYRYPASLTKLMTIYLTFQAIDRGKLKMSSMLPVSAKAASQPPTKLNLKKGSRISVESALLSLIVKSANDSAVVLAEAIAGSEWQFALMMNRTAKSLGMDHSNFKNASGLHDPEQKTTCYDLARLAVSIRRDFPKYYHLFSKTSFVVNGRKYITHNQLTRTYRGADGLKTGFVNASGYNLVTSAVRGNHKLVGVVLGGRTARSRDARMASLLDKAFYKMAKDDLSEKVKPGMNQ